ncbi:hypothetical protein ACSBR2_021577 [Camellia fascicularis]
MCNLRGRLNWIGIVRVASANRSPSMKIVLADREKMLDRNLFREDKGHNPEIIRKSQRRRFANVDLVDEDGLRKDFNKINKEVAKLKISGGDASEVIRSTEENQKLTAEKETEVQEARAALYSKLEIIGNIVHDSVPVDNGEDANANVLETSRCWRGYTALQTPFFMRKDIMAKCAQLAQFVVELYKVTGEGDDKYLIATAEQPLCAYHLDDWILFPQLPIRLLHIRLASAKKQVLMVVILLGFSEFTSLRRWSCFAFTSPNGNDSWDMHEEMITNSEEFYKMLKLPYQIVAIVSGALNDAAAKKYDLGGWFPAFSTYRQLSNEQAKQVVHLLNSTLTATERTMCCILENYQREDGVEIPEVLREYMG